MFGTAILTQAVEISTHLSAAGLLWLGAGKYREPMDTFERARPAVYDLLKAIPAAGSAS